MTDPRRKEWDKAYREKHKKEIAEYRRKNGVRLEANRDPVKRKASRLRHYLKTKERWAEYQRQKRAKARDWWSNAIERIETIVNRNKEK